MFRFIVLFIAIFVVACNNPSKKRENKKRELNTKAKLVTIIKDSTPIHMDTVPKVVIPENTIPVLTENEPDSTEKIYILTACDADAEDVPAFAPKLLWKGLFVTKDRAYIKNTKLNFSRVHGELDEDGDTTGWHITSTAKNNGYFISGDEIINGPVNAINITKKSLAPGEKELFEYNNVIYTIYATGYYNAKNEDVTNYKLYLLANIKGHSFNQLLTTIPYLGDEMKIEMDEQISIDFVGDIDGDKIPDFIIGKYGEFHGYSYLYLSKPAGEKAILKNVASFGSSD